MWKDLKGTNSYSHRVVSIWNELPNVVIEMGTITTFKIYIFRYIIAMIRRDMDHVQQVGLAWLNNLVDLLWVGPKGFHAVWLSDPRSPITHCYPLPPPAFMFLLICFHLSPICLPTLPLPFPHLAPYTHPPSPLSDPPIYSCLTASPLYTDHLPFPLAVLMQSQPKTFSVPHPIFPPPPTSRCCSTHRVPPAV